MVFAVVPSPALSASNLGHSGAKTASAVTYIAKIVSSITTLSSPSIALRFVSPTPFERLTKYACSDGMGSSSTKCSLVRLASRYSSVTLRESHAHTPQKNTSCHRYDFLVRLIGTDLLFFQTFYLGLITTPHVHMTYVYSFSHVSFFTQSHGQEKSLSYYDLFNFGVLLIYGRISTLIFFCFLHNSTTPILPVYVDQRRPNLEKDTTRSRSMVIQKIPAVPRRTLLTPD